MADYQNTRDTIAGATAEARDQATLDGLVQDTLTEFIEDGVTKLRKFALAECDLLQSVYLPNLLECENGAFYKCLKLNVVNLPKCSKLSSNVFSGNRNLQHLLLGASSVATSQTTTLSQTKIQSHLGAIYVPENLIANYKTNNYWKNYIIVADDKYPLDDFSTIEDDWETIVSNPSQYSIGDIKGIDLGTLGKHYMQLVAKGVDVKSDGTGNAPTTWISVDLIAFHAMNESNNTNIGNRIGWEGSEMRTWLKNTVKPLIPETVRNAILTVNKVQSIYSGSAIVKDGQTTQDDVWIPSDHEVGYGSNYETTGPVYSFSLNGLSTADSLVKYNNTSTTSNDWWIRSVSSNTAFRCVDYIGSASSKNATGTATGVVLGFCL